MRAFVQQYEKTYSEIMTEGRSVADAVKQHRHDESVFAFARELSDNVIGPMAGGELSSSGSEAKSRRLSFKGLGAKVTSQMLGQVGEKALAPSGAGVVGQEFKPDPVALGATGPLGARHRPGGTARHARVRLFAPDGADQRGSRGTRGQRQADQRLHGQQGPLAVVALLSKHLSLSLLAAHGPKATRALLQRTILDGASAASDQ